MRRNWMEFVPGLNILLENTSNVLQKRTDSKMLARTATKLLTLKPNNNRNGTA
jgi:hypothetical protein